MLDSAFAVRSLYFEIWADANQCRQATTDEERAHWHSEVDNAYTRLVREARVVNTAYRAVEEPGFRDAVVKTSDASSACMEVAGDLLDLD